MIMIIITSVVSLKVACVNTADDMSTSDNIFVNFCPVIPEFCRHIFIRKGKNMHAFVVSTRVTPELLD